MDVVCEQMQLYTALWSLIGCAHISTINSIRCICVLMSPQLRESICALRRKCDIVAFDGFLIVQFI